MHTDTDSNRNLSFRVRELIAAINEGLFDHALSVSALKVRCRVRDNNISSRFKYEVGVSIKDYILTLRLRAAREMIQLGRRPAAEVAYAVGFKYSQTFYRAYHRRYGTAPCSGPDGVRFVEANTTITASPDATFRPLSDATRRGPVKRNREEEMRLPR
jgi:transcriptional regulator GlxA family with amidase domain